LDNLKLDGKLLKPVAELLEIKIKNVLAIVAVKEKTAEITLKLEIKTIEREREDDFGNPVIYKEPIINYSITEKIRELKSVDKGGLGYGYQIDTDIISDEVYIQEIEE